MSEAQTAKSDQATTRPRRIGVVESDARTNTRRVAVRFKSKHPKYGKYVRQRTILQVHDAANDSHIGDIVEVEECRPMSRSKTWQLVRVVRRAAGEG
ncbi:MAG: 30S ribosomal protein S17 [Phycisphaerales bacterium]|nr:30S ribosomal protein S17 [Phycisphaerales bacterium]